MNSHPTLLPRTRQAIQWLIPTILLALIPKCPMCIASYIALFTGLGITFTTARAIQFTLIALCLGALAFLAFNLWRTHRTRPIQITLHHT